ncbi:hypothetical protein EHV15_13705 [Paenibacillus oralis]|uniref:Spore coat protein CotH n=1 Tax=Paenibacillus oralis TaxID=2490856 RepID=A0A3P3U1X2_9BACL|nr:CotH kinase family protein [Paenibacillus oralis]RRJ63866.1 hypothetical protein EHV15_13705 [Paenibacillus oralis]
MKRKGTRLLAWIGAALLFFGLIAGEAVYNAGVFASGSGGQTDGGKTAVSAEEQKLDEEVFPKDKVVDVKITIDEDDFQDMLDNASAEEFKAASVDYNGLHFDNIGIRTKGNLSLRSVVQMDDSDRYSFKLSFDEYVNQTLDGIQKINLNNNYSDVSYMREFLTYELAEEMGLPTPKHSFVNIYINGELWGFYLAVEQVGDAYLERNFGNSYGALYKGVMTGSGSDLLWLGDDPDAYTGLERKSKTTNGDILIKMLDELNNGSDYEKYIDVQEALGYIALNVLTNNMDSYIGGNKQNYYLYEDDGVFSVLPWDYNMAFGGMGGGMGRPGGRAAGGDGGANTPAGAANAPAGTDGAANAPAGEDGEANAPAGEDGEANTSVGTDGAANTSAGTDGAANAPAGAEGEAGGTATEGGKPAQAEAGNGRNSSSLLIDEPTQGAVSERPLLAKLLAVDEYKAYYHEILQQAVDGFLANEAFSQRVTALSEMIAPYVKADPTAFYTYEEFEQAVTQLIATNASQVENISQQLDGTIPSSGDGSGSGGGMGGMGGGMPPMGDGGMPEAGGNPDAGQNVPGNGNAQGDQQSEQQGETQSGQVEESRTGAFAAALTGKYGPTVQGWQSVEPVAAVASAQSGQSADNSTPDAQVDGQPAQSAQDGTPQQGNGAAGDNQQQGGRNLAGDRGQVQGGFPGGGGPMGGDGPMGDGRGPMGGGGGGPMGGGPGGFGQGAGNGNEAANRNEAILTGVSLLVLILSATFIAFYRRKRL